MSQNPMFVSVADAYDKEAKENLLREVSKVRLFTGVSVSRCKAF
jgi:hypothetical protein